MIRIGIVGTGAMAAYHVSRFARIPGASVLACSDRHIDDAASFAARQGLSAYFDSPEAMLASGKIDAVSVASADCWRLEPVLAALAQGLPVFCEKPLARTLPEAHAMAAAAREAGVPTIVNFSKRNGGLLSLASRLLSEGRIGQLRSASFSYGQAWLADGSWGDWRTTPRLAWRLDEERSTFGALGDLGSHLLDAALFLLEASSAPPLVVACLGRRFETGVEAGGGGADGPGDFRPAWESFEALLEAASVPVSVSANYRAPGQEDRFAVSLRGETASIELDFSLSKRSLRIIGARGAVGIAGGAVGIAGGAFEMADGAIEMADGSAEFAAGPIPTSYERFVALASGAPDPLPGERLDFGRGLAVQRLVDDCARLALGREEGRARAVPVAPAQTGEPAQAAAHPRAGAHPRTGAAPESRAARAATQSIRLGALVNGAGEAAATARDLAACGFESLQLSWWASTSGRDLGQLAEDMHAALDGSCCHLSALGVYGNPLADDEAGAETLRSIEALIEAAPAFGAALVSCFAGRLPGTSVPDSLPAFTAAFGKLCDRASRCGISLALENCRFSDTWKTGRWNIAINPDAWQLIFAALPGAPLGLEWEPAHQVMALAEPLAQLASWLPRILHIHAKDAHIDGELLGRHGLQGSVHFGREVLAGEGDSDWTGIFSILQAAGWMGSVDIEIGAIPEWQAPREPEGLKRAFASLSEARKRAAGG
ncbi:MAG: TIM barrel protein [Spirochaetota bacterium]